MDDIESQRATFGSGCRPSAVQVRAARRRPLPAMGGEARSSGQEAEGRRGLRRRRTTGATAAPRRLPEADGSGDWGGASSPASETLVAGGG